jgi:hypothetical protein
VPHRNIRTPADLDELWKLFSSLKPPFSVEWVMGENRSQQQSRLQFLWAREAAEQRGDRTPEEQRSEWKLRYGVPIMREDSPEFREVYDRLIKPLSYPQKIAAMELIQVTSLMKVRQMVRYLDAIERECAEQGVKLTDPDPDLAQYHERYRMKDAA